MSPDFSSFDGAAGAGSILASLLAAPPQPQPLLFASPQPQSLASQPQLCSQPQLWQPPQLPQEPWLPKLPKLPPKLPNEPLLPWLPPKLPKLPLEPWLPPQLPLLPNQPALALQGTANTATIKAIREKLMSIISIRVRVPADDVAWWRTPITG